MTAVKFYSSKDATWVNASGDKVPVKFVPQVDKRREEMAKKIYKAALNAETVLAELHSLVNTASNEVRTLIKEEYEIKGKSKKETKSITWFNFDKSFKIEADVHEVVKWDEALCAEAYTLFKEYINESLTGDKELINGLISETFGNSRGIIDTKKAFQIIKYGRKIRATKYQKACALLTDGQGIDKSKLYHRLFEKMEDGSYRNINLQFSNI